MKRSARPVDENQTDLFPVAKPKPLVIPEPKFGRWPPCTIPGRRRAGTVIDHKNAIKVYATGPKLQKVKRVGYIDLTHRVFQTGGQAKDFIFWIHNAISYPKNVWDQLIDRYAGLFDWLEMYDSDAEICFRTSMADAVRHGFWYTNKIGPRWGVPVVLWEKIVGQL
jgi:hypothetical protein